ncbi:MAG: YggS family pyridoxal phosphate-dependent enzyme [Chloroflexota bacterium]|nr:YggS family pyridoxal phosphate-dependent enzyme [Chloroflexota bacterium]
MSVSDNIKHVQDRIADACAKAQRDPADITLVAVTKQKTAPQILEAVDAGLQHLGENRVEEAVAKIPQVNDDANDELTWHMVGHVQSRKAKHVVQQFDMVQSVDSLKLARRFSRLAGERERRLKILLEINVSGEASKYGLAGYNWYRDSAARDDLWPEIGEIAALPQLEVNGLMTMAPYDADEKTIRRVFADLFGLRNALANELNLSLPELSMGMTNDYPIAIEEGATMIRIGRAIFGERD